MIIAVASMLANSDYAFLEPTLGDHATANKVRPRPRLRLGVRVRVRLGLALALALAVTLTLTLTLPSNPDKVATTPDSIGMLFSIASVTYTLSCPLTGILAKRSRLGPRRVIVTGLVLQLVGFLLIGPSPILRTGAPVPVPAPVPAPARAPVPAPAPAPLSPKREAPPPGQARAWRCPRWARRSCSSGWASRCR